MGADLIRDSLLPVIAASFTHLGQFSFLTVNFYIYPHVGRQETQLAGASQPAFGMAGTTPKAWDVGRLSYVDLQDAALDPGPSSDVPR